MCMSNIFFLLQFNTFLYNIIYCVTLSSLYIISCLDIHFHLHTMINFLHCAMRQNAQKCPTPSPLSDSVEFTAMK